jgi:hypothetical protein
MRLTTGNYYEGEVFPLRGMENGKWRMENYRKETRNFHALIILHYQLSIFNSPEGGTPRLVLGKGAYLR